MVRPARSLPAAIAVAPRATASRQVADALRIAIIDGTLAPGAPLRQDAIARHFSVSAIPVREALRQLQGEGWAKVELHKGATVAPLFAAEAQEIYEMRAALESLAIALAIPRHTPSTLREVEKHCKAAASEPQPSRYVAHNTDFHTTLYAPAERPQLIELIGLLHRRGERYLHLKFGMPSYKSQSDKDHASILAAVKKRDVAAAQTLLVEHLLGTGRLVSGFLLDTTEAPPKRPRMKKRSRA